MMAFIARLVVKPEKAAEFERLQVELKRLTDENEPGTIAYHFIRHREAPNTYVVYSAFEDEAAFEAHQKSSFHDELVPPIMNCLAEEMDLQFFDGVD
jgi:quinol monooxygenase YgiN